MNRLILFLDFDGTLTPIVPRPNRARLNRPVRETLRKLVGLLQVVIISGRVPKDLRRRVGLQKVCYVGHHGLSCLEVGGDVTWSTTPPHRTLVRRWVQALQIVAEGIEGAFVEDKGMTVALHDRLVKPKQRSRLRRRAWRLLAPWIEQGSVSLLRGNRVLEARSSRAGSKGTAVSMLLRRPWARHRVPVYFGDDHTDFDAFSVEHGRGLENRIGGRRGAVGEDAWIPHPKTLHSVLDWLAARQQGGDTDLKRWFLCDARLQRALMGRNKRKQPVTGSLSHSGVNLHAVDCVLLDNNTFRFPPSNHYRVFSWFPT